MHVFIILIFYHPSKLSGVDRVLNITKISYFHITMLVLSLVGIKPSAKKSRPPFVFDISLYTVFYKVDFLAGTKLSEYNP